MFTSHMTEDELQAVAYRDFLEIRMKVKIAFEQFINRLRLRRGEKRVLHSLIEEKNVLTKSKNTWHVVFINTSYTAADAFISLCTGTTRSIIYSLIIWKTLCWRGFRPIS